MKLEYQAVQSDSRVDTIYVVTIAEDMPVACTCKAFQHNAMSGGYACKHMSRLWNGTTAVNQ